MKTVVYRPVAEEHTAPTPGDAGVVGGRVRECMRGRDREREKNE